jgi:hypothetical protein
VWDYERYLAKDLFYFQTYEISGFGRDNLGKYLYICPADFNLFEAGMYNLEYRIEVMKTYEGFSEGVRQSYTEVFTKQLEDMRTFAKEATEAAMERAYWYLSPEDFLARPGF